MKKISLLTFCLLCTFDLFAQILTPVKWSYAAKKMNGKEVVVLIKASIDEGWHIYSVNQKAGGPVKTSFAFSRAKEYMLIGKLTEPKPLTKYEPNFKMDIQYFVKSVVFQQKLRVYKKGFVLKGKLNFMVCNDEKCLPPADIVFNIPINGTKR